MVGGTFIIALQHASDSPLGNQNARPHDPRGGNQMPDLKTLWRVKYSPVVSVMSVSFIFSLSLCVAWRC